MSMLLRNATAVAVVSLTATAVMAESPNDTPQYIRLNIVNGKPELKGPTTFSSKREVRFLLPENFNYFAYNVETSVSSIEIPGLGDLDTLLARIGSLSAGAGAVFLPAPGSVGVRATANDFLSKYEDWLSKISAVQSEIANLKKLDKFKPYVLAQSDVDEIKEQIKKIKSAQAAAKTASDEVAKALVNLSKPGQSSNGGGSGNADVIDDPNRLPIGTPIKKSGKEQPKPGEEKPKPGEEKPNPVQVQIIDPPITITDRYYAGKLIEQAEALYVEVEKVINAITKAASRVDGKTSSILVDKVASGRFATAILKIKPNGLFNSSDGFESSHSYSMVTSEGVFVHAGYIFNDKSRIDLEKITLNNSTAFRSIIKSDKLGGLGIFITKPIFDTSSIDKENQLMNRFGWTVGTTLDSKDRPILLGITVPFTLISNDVLLTGGAKWQAVDEGVGLVPGETNIYNSFRKKTTQTWFFSISYSFR